MKKEDALRSMSEALVTSFSKVKDNFNLVQEDLDEHLTSINENTQEISLVSDHALELEGRVDKMEEKLCEIHYMLSQLVKQNTVSISLTKEEQKAFLVLFTYDSFADSNSIAQKAGIREDVTKDLVLSLIDKGVPIQREHIQGMQLYKMDADFRDKQARSQTVKIDEDIKQQYKNTLLNQFFE